MMFVERLLEDLGRFCSASMGLRKVSYNLKELRKRWGIQGVGRNA